MLAPFVRVYPDSDIIPFDRVTVLNLLQNDANPLKISVGTRAFLMLIQLVSAPVNGIGQIFRLDFLDGAHGDGMVSHWTPLLV